MHDYKHYLMGLIFVAAELAICGLVMYYLRIEDTTCDEVNYALGASVIAQFVHIIIVALNLFARPAHSHFVTLGIWLCMDSVFVTFAGLLITSETCKTTPDFNVAFGIVLAEILISFLCSCCSFCTDPSENGVRPNHQEPPLTEDQRDALRDNRPTIEVTDVIVVLSSEQISSVTGLADPINYEPLNTTPIPLGF